MKVNEIWSSPNGRRGNNPIFDEKIAPPLKLEWKKKFSGPYSTSIGISNLIIVPSKIGITAFSIKNGKEKWEFPIRENIELSNLLGYSGNVYINTGKYIRSISIAKGKENWKVKAVGDLSDETDIVFACGKLAAGPFGLSLKDGSIEKDFSSDDYSFQYIGGEKFSILMNSETGIIKKLNSSFKVAWQIKYKGFITTDCCVSEKLFGVQREDQKEVNWIELFNLNTGKLACKIKSESIGNFCIEGNRVFFFEYKEKTRKGTTGSITTLVCNSAVSGKEIWRLSECHENFQGIDTPSDFIVVKNHIIYTFPISMSAAKFKTKIRMINKKSGKIDFETILDHFVERILAINNRLIFVGRGMIYCFKGKGSK